jgi:threonine/homoserine/homoserine lactone efflux protein
MLFLGLIIVTVMILVDLPIVLAAGGFAEWLERRSSAASVLGKLMGLLLIGLAVYVAITRRPA